MLNLLSIRQFAVYRLVNINIKTANATDQSMTLDTPTDHPVLSQRQFIFIQMMHEDPIVQSPEPKLGWPWPCHCQWGGGALVHSPFVERPGKGETSQSSYTHC